MARWSSWGTEALRMCSSLPLWVGSTVVRVRGVLPDACRLDLFDTTIGYELQREPHRLEAPIGRRAEGAWVVLDEIQRVPALLDDRPDRAWLGTALETHLLHECRVRNAVSGQARGLYWYGLAAGSAIDLVVETRRAQPAG